MSADDSLTNTTFNHEAEDTIIGRSDEEGYEALGVGRRFCHELMDIPGHDGVRTPDSALDSPVYIPAGTGSSVRSEVWEKSESA